MSIDQGFDFLGWNFRRYKAKFLIKPSNKNVKAFYAKAKEVSANKTAKQEELISLLNPILRGWANYHRPVVAKATFNRLDGLIFRAIWSWSKRRHRNKSASWIRKRYFRSEGNRNLGVLHHGCKRRWQAGNGGANPLGGHAHPQAHKRSRGATTPSIRPMSCMARSCIRYACCMTCITASSGLGCIARKTVCVHTAEARSPGKRAGTTTTSTAGWMGAQTGLENRVLLHPVCHAKVHSQGIIVVKPDARVIRRREPYARGNSHVRLWAASLRKQ